MVKNTILLIVGILSVGFFEAVGADALSERVSYVVKQLGCDLPYYLVSEKSETGGFYAETKLIDPQRLESHGITAAGIDYFVSIRESQPGLYFVKVVPRHDMLDSAVERRIVIESETSSQNPADLQASGITIKGVITNYQELKANLSPATFLQLVETFPGVEVKGVKNNGFINLPSDLPKASVSADGRFEVKTDALKPGSYWLYLQNFKPAENHASAPDAILVKGGQRFQILISEDVKSLIVDCGKLSVSMP